MAGTIGSIGGSGGGSSSDVEFKILCDSDGAGTVTRFLRRYTSVGGVVTAADTQLDGTTAYTVAGTIGDCDAASTVTDECFIVSFDGAGFTAGDRILRLTVWDVSVTPPALIAQTYHNQNTGAAIAAPNLFWLRPCDKALVSYTACYKAIAAGAGYAIGDTLLVTRVEDYTVVTAPVTTIILYYNVTSGTAFDSNTVTLIPGVDIEPCENSIDQEIVTLCDTDATTGTITQFLRRYRIDSNGSVISVADVELDGTTAYTTVGTVGNCQCSDVILERCYQEGGTPALCTEDSYPRVLWENSLGWDVTNPDWPAVETDLLAGTATSFTNVQSSGINVELTLTGGATGIGPDTDADALLMTIPDGQTATLAHGFSQSTCAVFSIRVYNNAPLTITSDAAITASHNTSNPLNQGDPPVITGNNSTSVTVTSPTNSRMLFQISGTQQVTIAVSNNTGAQLDHFVGMHIGQQAAGTGGIIYKVYDYADGTQLIVNTTDPTDRPAAIDPAWAIADCGSTVVASMDSEIVLLCDDNGSFLRHIVHDTDGSVKRTYDTDLSGMAAYTPVGTVKVCAASVTKPCMTCRS